MRLLQGNDKVLGRIAAKDMPHMISESKISPDLKKGIAKSPEESKPPQVPDDSSKRGELKQSSESDNCDSLDRIDMYSPGGVARQQANRINQTNLLKKQALDRQSEKV